jgi:NADH:ubiquinone oxidoreductase subunit F (NADH-binding)
MSAVAKRNGQPKWATRCPFSCTTGLWPTPAINNVTTSENQTKQNTSTAKPIVAISRPSLTVGAAL